MTAYLDAMRRYFDFSGRSTRTQFWSFCLTVLGLGIAAIVLDTAVLGASKPSLFTWLVYFPHLIPSIAVTIRRLHDSDKSGWWILLGLVPLVGVVALIVFGCLPSSSGRNRFGAKGEQHAAASAAVAATAQTTLRGASMLDEMEKLTALRASGAIDDAEFQQMKARLLY